MTTPGVDVIEQDKSWSLYTHYYTEKNPRSQKSKASETFSQYERMKERTPARGKGAMLAQMLTFDRA